MFIRFALVGVAGFIVDAAVLTIMLWVGTDFYTGRLVSFLCAVTGTWFANRSFTFKSEDPNLIGEWARFVSTNAVGGTINYVTYALLVATTAYFAEHPVFAVGVGSIAGLAWNFAASKHLVFKKQRA